MTAAPTTPRFKDNVHEALHDARLQRALNTAGNFVPRRAAAAERLPEFEALRDSARDIKDHTLAHLDLYLEAYERRVVEAGGHVHYARDAEEARRHFPRPLRAARRQARHQGQVDDLRGDRPQSGAGGGRHRGDRDRSRRIHHPASPRGADRISSRPRSTSRARTSRPTFARRTCICRATATSRQPETLLAEAREILRQKFLSADIGVTGANFLIAETGTSIIVTNEGNGDLTQILPKVHVVIASLEKITPTLDDAAQLLRVLARSATGQDMSVYTTLSTGPRRPDDPDGPEEYHVILLDNGRSSMLAGRVRRHAALHPLRRLHEPLPRLSGGRRPRLRLGLSRPDGRGADALADWRRRGRPTAQRLDLLRPLRGGLPDAHSAAEDDAALARARVRAPSARRRRVRYGLGVWAFFAKRPALYRFATDLAMRALALAGRARGPLRMAAAGRRLDALPRSRRAAGRHVSGALAGQERGGAMSARDEMFASIRRSLHVTGRRGAAPRRGRRPSGADALRRDPGARAGRPRRTSRTRRCARRATLTRSRLVGRNPRRDRPLPARAQSARDAAHRRRSAARRPALGAKRRWRSSHGASDGHDLNAASVAFAAIAETGTLALVSGADNPTTLNFLPDNHVVVVFAEDVVGDMESVFARLREKLRRRARAAHAQFHHRPVALGRYRADAAVRRAWAAPAAYRGGEAAPAHSRGSLRNEPWNAQRLHQQQRIEAQNRDRRRDRRRLQHTARWRSGP